jgi:hypothetical protein
MSLRGKYRHISLRHEGHLINNTSPALAPGEARFLSYYLPSLPAGEYNIQVDQHVTAPSSESKDAVPAKHDFEVLAPEWALAAGTGASESDDDSAVVLSVFPAPGETAPSFRTLPHLVLRDAQMPWVRRVSEKVPDNHANEIPWFALIVFTAEELSLDEEHRKSYFNNATINNATINDTLGWDIPAGNVVEVRDTANGKNRLANFIPKASTRDKDAQTKTSLITVPADLFKSLFTNANSIDRFDVSPFRFMSHVRTVALAGTMSAATASDTDSPDPIKNGTSTFSMVVSHRLGPTNVDVPTPVLAHLVSLHGIDTKGVNVLDGAEHVLMTSLYSWTYTALPPGSPDVVSMLRYLGNKDQGLKVLRTDLTKDKKDKNKNQDHVDTSQMDPSEKNIADLVTKRQIDGYTLVRHRTVTGEQTAAIFRGPLSPTRVPHPLHKDVSFQYVDITSFLLF